MNNQIVITGATGFVGKNLAPYLERFNFYIKPIKVLTGIELSAITYEAVIHLAGIAHDFQNANQPGIYYDVNTELTKNLFDSFLSSEANLFIYISSVKAVSDSPDGILTEDFQPNPKTHYGKSKLLAENYILSKIIPNNKRVYILRPCMIHGPNNNGNLNLLYVALSKIMFWPLACYKNERSFLTIDNFCFIIKEILTQKNIESGVYNVADDGTITTNDLITLISEVTNKKIILLRLPKLLVRLIAKFGDIFVLPFNTERLNKLTENYIVSNEKIITELKIKLPVNIRDGIKNTIKSFQSK